MIAVESSAVDQIRAGTDEYVMSIEPRPGSWVARRKAQITGLGGVSWFGCGEIGLGMGRGRGNEQESNDKQATEHSAISTLHIHTPKDRERSEPNHEINDHVDGTRGEEER